MEVLLFYHSIKDSARDFKPGFENCLADVETGEIYIATVGAFARFLSAAFLQKGKKDVQIRQNIVDKTGDNSATIPKRNRQAAFFELY